MPKASLGDRLLASLLLAIIWLHGKLVRPEKLPSLKEKRDKMEVKLGCLPDPKDARDYKASVKLAEDERKHDCAT